MAVVHLKECCQGYGLLHWQISPQLIRVRKAERTAVCGMLGAVGDTSPVGTVGPILHATCRFNRPPATYMICA